MAGTTGERPLADIVTSPQFWLLHVVNFPAVFISGWLFVSSGLAYDVFGTPRPDQYFAPSMQSSPIVSERYQARQQLDQYLQQQSERSAPSLK